MQLIEHFLSIQGEGKYVGHPSIFVRFASCNLRCPAFGVDDGENIGCDTTRAVYKNPSWQDISYTELVKIVDSYPANIKNIILTGGEPLLNHKNKDFIKFVEYLVQNNFHITVETNATIKIDFDKYPIYKHIVFAMGVKLSNSGESEAKRINIEAIHTIISNSKESFLKFVCDEDVQINEKEIKKLLVKLPKCDVYCMPMGITDIELNKVALKLTKMCIKNNFNYTDRLHIRLWGNTEKT
ncbi:MAG: Queuosine Biosynthesis QueE Radical SAM [uncultured Campylobacterales bacterium]|uniref:7-carboxy-7-deazaguanine synthase n=1 Tax=uncultured Campylobacterales bacterium TaxID=352960 RepID=A0A6S6SES2_9BACT|nr:MAG: Queuosine Biosynthesis QueE Radical SAM [uncultured Campylobacterales bacterium]